MTVAASERSWLFILPTWRDFSEDYCKTKSGPRRGMLLFGSFLPPFQSADRARNPPEIRKVIIMPPQTTTPRVRNLMTRAPVRRASLLIPVVLGCYGNCPTVQA